MGKSANVKKPQGPGKPGAGPAHAFSPPAQEMRALLRRIPDGFQATLNALAARPAEERERVMAELARGLGKEILPLIRAAALGSADGLAHSALRVLPVFGTRAAGDVLVEAYQAHPDGERGKAARLGALALQARGINVAVPEPEPETEPRLVLRETHMSSPDGVGSRSVAARLQDEYGVWHAVFVLWNDTAGVRDGFMRPMSRKEWEERQGRVSDRGLDWVPCPADFARWQVARARELNAQSGAPLKDHLKDWDAWVGAAPEGYQPPDPTAALAAASEEQRAEWLSTGADLYQLPDAQRWFLEIADAAPFARRWADLRHRLRLRGESDALTAEMTEVVAETARELIPEAEQARYRERLLDLSRVLEWRHQELPARRAAAAAAALNAGTPLHEIPFFAELVRRTLAAGAEMLAQGRDPERLRHRPNRPFQS